eukprot:SAG22_NODE_1225_length_5115_cov_1.965510_4_plen_107_part_00
MFAASWATQQAKVYDSEQLTFAGITSGEVQAGDAVICRYEGPRGAPGMPEMLSLTSALVGVGLGACIALQASQCQAMPCMGREGVDWQQPATSHSLAPTVDSSNSS